MTTTRSPGHNRPALIRTPAPRKGAKGPSTGTKLRAWGLLGAAVLGVLLVLWLATRLLGGGGGAEEVPPAATGATGAGSVPFAPAPPEGAVHDSFPRPAVGTRLELKVIALGDDPSVCVAEGLQIRGDVRTVYHHGCKGDEGIDRAFFLVRVTNRSDGRVALALEGFSLRTEDGVEHEALVTPPAGVPASRFFPPTVTIGPGVSFKRWVTFDGSDGERPGHLAYADGDEELSVRFRGRWV